MNPILKYSGGKTKEIKLFKKYIPKFDTYIEPFFGGGAVYFYLEPEKAIINDINYRLIEFYVDLVKEYAKTRKELDFLEKEYKVNRTAFEEKKMQYPDEKVPDANEHIYYEIRDMFNKKIDPQYTYAAIYYYINKTAYSGMIRYNKAGEYNVPYGRYKNFNTHLLTDNHYNLLKTAKIMNTDYVKAFKLAKPNDFIFLDPPYDTTFSEYGNEVFTGDFGEDEHRRLAEDFKNLSCKVMMIIGERN